MALAGLALLSCSKDDDNAPDQIEGRWYLFSIETIRKKGANTQIDIDTLEEKDQIITFLPNGVFSVEGVETNYRIEGDSLHIVLRAGEIEELESFRYGIDRNDLMLSTSDFWNETHYEDIHRYKRL